MIAPAAVKFNTDYYIFGNTYRCAFAVKGYPPTTEDLALLYRLSEMSGVNIRLTARKLADGEEDAIIQASSNKNRMELGATKMKQSVVAEAALEDVRGMLLKQRNDREALGWRRKRNRRSAGCCRWIWSSCMKSRPHPLPSGSL